MKNNNRITLLLILCFICNLHCFSVDVSTENLLGVYNNDKTESIETPDADDKHNEKTLDEVVVEAKRAVRVEDGLNYIPTPKEKRSATSAEYLLGLMPISSLKFDWSTGGVSHINGRGIKYYINGREATQWEIHMIPVRDIRSVEVLENPTDPKYKNAENVINYIVQEYEYGVYGRLDAEQCFTMDFGRYDFSGRYTRGNWSVSAYGGFNYWVHGMRQASHTQLIMSENDMEGDIVNMDESSDRRYRNDNGTGIARVAYTKKGLNLINEIAFRYDKMPYDRSTTTKKYNDNPDVTAVSHDTRKAPSVSYFGELMLAKKDSWYWAQWRYEYADTDGDSDYNLFDTSSPMTITSDYRDTRHYAYAEGRYYRQLNKIHTLGAGLFVTESYNKTRYIGTTNYFQKTSKTDIALRAIYNYRPASGARHQLSAFISECFLSSPEQGSKSYIGSVVSYAMNTNVGMLNTLGIYANYWRNGATAATFNSAHIITNEIMGNSGNPNLKTSDNLSTTVSFTWLASNRFMASASVNYTGLFNDIVSMHRPYNGIMYSTMVNSGDYNNVNINTNTEISIVPGVLSMSPSVSYSHYWHSGLLHIDRGHWSVSLPVTCVTNFGLTASLTGSYMSPSQYEDDLIRYKEHSWRLYASLSYKYRNLSLLLNVSNPWYKNDVQRDIRNEKFYRSVIENTYLRHGRTITLKLSYTFNAGKRISGEELKYNGFGNSGLL